MNNKKHNKSSMKNLNKLLTNKARYITITLSIIFIVLSKHAISQTIPASDRLEILKNHEIYEILLEGPRQTEAATLISKNAIIYWNHGKLDSALILFDQASQIFYNNESYDDLKTIYTNMGSVCIGKNDFKSTMKYYNRSLDISKQTGSNVEVAADMINISNAYMLNNQPDKALELVEDAMQIAKNEGNHNIVLNCFNQIAEIYNSMGKAWKSKEFYLRYNHYTDSVEGNVYDLNALLVSEKSKFDLTEGKAIAITKPSKQKTKIEQQQKITDQSKVVDDFFAKKKKEAFETLAKEVVKVEKVDSSDIESQKRIEDDENVDFIMIEKRFVRILIIAISMFLILIISIIILYFKRRNKSLNLLLKDQKKAIIELNNLLSEKSIQIETKKDDIKAQGDAQIE